MSLKPEDLPVLCTITLRAMERCLTVLDRLQDRLGSLDEKLTEKEKKLIRIIREINYGEIKVVIQDKQPVRIEEVKKSIKL